jgi:lysophospholipase L1-like esterase
LLGEAVKEFASDADMFTKRFALNPSAEMKTHNFFLFAAACWLLFFAGIPLAAAQGTGFTYQGRLYNGGNAAYGLYDFRFKLAADPLATSYAGSPILTNSVSLTDGLFTVVLDFGTGIFSGSNYWLEVGVRTNGEANFTVLTPLQPVMPVPYAVFAGAASNLSGTLPAAQLSGAVPAANLGGVYTNAVVFSNASGNFSGNGGGLAGVTASQLGTSNSPAVIYGLVSNQADVVSIACVLTNLWVGGPFWSSNFFAPTAWPYFQPPMGTNITGGGITASGFNNLVFVKHNKVNVASSNSGLVANYSVAGAYTGNTGFETALVGFLFNLNSDSFCVGLAGAGGTFKVLVDGVDNGTDMRLPADGNNYTYQIVFSSVAQRQIEFLLDGSANNALEGIYVPPTGSFAPYASAKLLRFVIIGDSFTEDPIPANSDAQGYPYVGIGYGTRLGQLLPALDVWSLGSGGTGYSNTDNGQRLDFPNRMQVDVISNQPNYVLLAGGINDASYPTNQLWGSVTNTIGQIVAGSPGTTLFALGPWWPRSPVDPKAINVGIVISNAMAIYGLGSNYIDNLTGAGGPWITGVYNVPGSGNAVQYISSDSTHPTSAGHSYLAQRLAVELINRGVPSTPTPSTPANSVTRPAGGLASTANNGMALASIAVGPSPFSFTNNSGMNIFVFCSGGTLNAMTLNGTPLPPAFLTGAVTYPLQPNEILTMTYTAPPSMLWKPF